MSTTVAIPQTGNKVLRPEVVKAINTPHHRIRLASILGCTEQAVMNLIKNNNPKLTQYAPLLYIKDNVMQSFEFGELVEPQKEVA